MAIIAKRRENETIDKLINRFKKQAQSFRLVQFIRGKKYFTKPLTKRLIRKSAVKREENRTKRKREVILN